MRVKDKSTEIDIKLTETNNNAGLSKNDYWCKVSIKVQNNEMNFNEEFESLSKKENKRGIKLIEEFYKSNMSGKIQLNFIKNYIMVFLENKKNKKIMKLTLVSTNENQECTILIEDEEIKEFLKMVKKSTVK